MIEPKRISYFFNIHYCVTHPVNSMTLTNGTDVLGLAPGLLSSINLTIYSENSLLEDAILTGKLVKQASWSCNESTDISQRTCRSVYQV